MELKLPSMKYILLLGLLLIVPYGIETKDSGNDGGEGGRLLIVPYGIETML